MKNENRVYTILLFYVVFKLFVFAISFVFQSYIIDIIEIGGSIIFIGFLYSEFKKLKKP